MRADLIDLLAKGLLHLGQGGTVRGYVEHAQLSGTTPEELSELGSLLETAAMASRLGEIPVPAPRAASTNRARFLSSAASKRESIAERRSVIRWGVWPRFVRMAVSLTLVSALLLSAGSGVMSVAAASLPGSALYPVKLAVEDARLLLTTGDLRRAELYLRYANERTEEMLQLCAAGQPVDPTVIERFTVQLEGAVTSAASVARGTEPGAAVEILEEVIKAASEQQQTLSEASVDAPETFQPALNAGAAAAQQTGQTAQQELAQLIAVLPTPTQLAQLPATWTPVPVLVQPTSTPVPPPVVAPTQAPPPTPNPAPTVLDPPSATATTPSAVAPSSTRTSPRNSSPTPVTAASGTVLPPRPSRTEVSESRTPSAAATVPPAATATAPGGDPLATPTLPAARFRLQLDDSTDPVPASFRIHYAACAINESDVALTNTSIRISWSPASCAYLPPDNLTSYTFAVGVVEAGSRVCVNLSLNTSVICGESLVTAEATLICDQGSASETETTTLGKPPTPTPTVTRTPVVLIALTISDQPDPVPAGNALHLEFCVINHGDQPLTNVVLEDIWSPRDCVYLAPDNPFRIRWTWKSLPAHTRQCVPLVLSSYSTCEGSLVSNRATMTCDQGSVSAEQLTTVGNAPTATPTHTATRTATPTEPAIQTSTPTQTATEPPVIVPTATEKHTESRHKR